MEFVVMYRLSEGIDFSRVHETYPRHEAYFEAFHAGGGGLLALGPFQTMDPAGASMGIFTSREDAERFIAGDPFVLEGLAHPRILEWDAVRFG
ncbi:YciI family protein [Arthrobacter sp.]|uniref:YciI family protein n=1 Tax=Arthrobacter sp. TaxID=1667 RepID=UPI0028128CC1|nr:YciI family protein [Arthrobacter sp.]